MSNRISKSILAASLAAAASVAVADDELIVYATQDGEAFKGATIILDGTVEENVPRSGIVKFDLDGGTHTVEVLDVFKKVHQFRFDSVDGQLVDAAVSVNAGQAKHFVETFSRIESAAARRSAPKGTLTGKVNLAGADVTGATVTVEETGDVVTVDASGEYEFTLPRGEYDLVVNHPEASKPQTLTTRIVSNITRGKNFYLSSAASAAAAPALENPLDSVPEGLVGDVEEVMVTATFNPNAFGETEQFSSSVVNTLEFEEIARFGDSDVSGAVIRMPSVTVQDDSQVFIRGLGGRYVTTTLNGATLPSTNPNKRTIPLDLFPSNIVSQLDVKKTFIATMPGESTGGNLVINTRSFPDERAGKLSLSVGAVSGLTGERVSSDPLHGEFDHVGFDDGSRKESGVLYAMGEVIRLDREESEFNLNSEQLAEVQRLGALEIQDGWDLDRVKVDPNVSVGLNFGDVFYTPGDYELGVFVAANYKNSWSQHEDGEANSWTRSASGDGVIQQNDFTYQQVSNEIRSSGLLSLGLNMDSTTLEAVTLVSRTAESKIQEIEGLGGDSLLEEKHHTISWVERQFLSQQIGAEHLFGDSFIAEWQITGSQATRYAPDRRVVKFIKQDGDDLFSVDRPALTRRFDDLVDSNLDASFNLDYTLDFASFTSDIEFGFQSISRERDSDSRSYGFTQSQSPEDDLAPNALVSDVINYESVVLGSPSAAVLNNQTSPSDSYDAEMTLDAAYISFDTDLSVVQLVAGVRFEDFEQSIESKSITDFQLLEDTLAETTVLPSLGLTVPVNDSIQFRAAYSETVSRPDFKEMSRATFYEDDFTDVVVIGNPNIQMSSISNFDLRAEYFGEGGNKLTIAAFYKDMQDAIERVVQAASGTAANARTFRNANEAEIYGFEIDSRLEFDLGSNLSKSMFVGVNASRIGSRVIEDDEAQSRTLQGQPEYTFNLILGYDNFDVDSKLTLLLNQNGSSIRDLGAGAQPDIFEEPRLDLNLNYSRQFGEAIGVKVKLKNLLNSDVEFSQGGEIFRKYSQGVSYEAGIDWNF